MEHDDTLAARIRAEYVGEDAIAFDELKPEVRARWERVAAVASAAPIRVPFSNAQIDAMAKAAKRHMTVVDSGWADAIRAALTAGGLEPCAVPEYKPEDVALRPERASDEELDALAQNAWKTDTGKHAAVRAVRARVEAPLLAEIHEHRRHVGIVMAREAELKARVAELEALYGLETAIALKTERDTLRAEVQRLEIECQDRAFYVTEFAAVSKERDAMKARVAALEHERDVVIIERDSEERHAERYLEEQKALRAELEAAQAECKHLNAIIRAAKARVDCDDQVEFQKHFRIGHSFSEGIDWLNSRIVYGVQLPPTGPVTPAELEDFDLIDGEGRRKAAAWINSRIATHTGPTRAEAEAKWKELHNRDFTSLHNAQDYLDWLLPQLPDERAEMPSARDLVLMIRESANKANCPYSSIHGAADLIAPELLTALHPWLRAPTGWELDVTAEEFAEWLGCDTVAAKSVLSDLRSRIRPTFGPCKECALLRSRLEQSERMSDKRHEISHRYHQDIKKAHAVLSAALEGE